MDFSYDEQQQALRDLAVQILSDRATVDAHKALEAQGEWFDRGTWKAFADAGLLGIPVPEANGGLGLGFMEIAVVCTEIGRTVAKLPFLGHAVAASALATFGPSSLGDAWLAKAADGTAVLSVAVADPAGASAVKASADGRLDGEVSFVPGGLWADLVLVAATGPDGSPVVAAVEPGADGVTVVRQDTSSVPEARLTFSGAPAVLVEGGRANTDVAEWLRQRMTAGLCATAAGVTDAALRLTAGYVNEREQFGRKLSTFQAVGQRAADSFIDVKGIRLTALQAASVLASGDDAEAQVAVAKFWACEGGQRVAYACQHLHGGIGVDRDYPLFRYFLAARTIDLTLGGATSQLIRLGEILAERPVACRAAASAAVGAEDRVGVHGVAAARVELEVGVGGSARRVTGVAGEADHLAGGDPPGRTDQLREVRVVVAVAVVAVEPDGRPPEAAAAVLDATAHHGVVRGAPRRHHVGPLVPAAARAGGAPRVDEHRARQRAEGPRRGGGDRVGHHRRRPDGRGGGGGAAGGLLGGLLGPAGCGRSGLLAGQLGGPGPAGLLLAPLLGHLGLVVPLEVILEALGLVDERLHVVGGVARLGRRLLLLGLQALELGPAGTLVVLDHAQAVEGRAVVTREDVGVDPHAGRVEQRLVVEQVGAVGAAAHVERDRPVGRVLAERGQLLVELGQVGVGGRDGVGGLRLLGLPGLVALLRLGRLRAQILHLALLRLEGGLGPSDVGRRTRLGCRRQRRHGDGDGQRDDEQRPGAATRRRGERQARHATAKRLDGAGRPARRGMGARVGCPMSHGRSQVGRR
jgi:acyl-CoA dehydrogenase